MNFGHVYVYEHRRYHYYDLEAFGNTMADGSVPLTVDTLCGSTVEVNPKTQNFAGTGCQTCQTEREALEDKDTEEPPTTGTTITDVFANMVRCADDVASNLAWAIDRIDENNREHGIFTDRTAARRSLSQFNQARSVYNEAIRGS